MAHRRRRIMLDLDQASWARGMLHRRAPWRRCAPIKPWYGVSFRVSIALQGTHREEDLAIAEGLHYSIKTSARLIFASNLHRQAPRSPVGVAARPISGGHPDSRAFGT